MPGLYHLRLASIGRTTHGPGQLRATLEYVLRQKALERAYGNRIPLARDQAAEWASWYVDPHRDDALRANARVADSFDAALPNGLSADSHARIAREFMRRLTGEREDEIPWLIAVHRGLEDTEDPAERNDHAHGVIIDRTIVRASRKRSVIGMSNRPDAADYVRGCWEAAVNDELERVGRGAEWIDRRSLLAQQIDAILANDPVRAAELDRRPTIHVGGAGRGKSRRGEDASSRHDYEDLDVGRSRAEANAERLAERDTARARARQLAEASEAARLRALADLAASALARVTPLSGPLLERLGGPQIRNQLASARAAAIARLHGLTVPPSAPRPAVPALRPFAAVPLPTPFAAPRLPAATQPFSPPTQPLDTRPWLVRQTALIREAAAEAVEVIATTMTDVVRRLRPPAFRQNHDRGDH